MRILFIILAIGMTALAASAVLYGPAHAGQGSDNVVTLLGTGGGQSGADSPAFLLVKGGGHHGHHGHRGARFFGGVIIGSPFLYGAYSDWGYGDGEGYFTQESKSANGPVMNTNAFKLIADFQAALSRSGAIFASRLA